MTHDEDPYAENAAYEETSATLRALEHMAPDDAERALADRDGYDTRARRYQVCEQCGQGGYTGQYPFSTLGGEQPCDDCV